MAGVLVSGVNSGVEATGVYKGVLVEDMIDTVNRVKKPFIDVFIKGLFFSDADYPLTYVPMINMVLPLKKDQEVWVYFNQGNHRYPVLWKLAADVDKQFTGTTELPAITGLVSFPNAEETTEVTKFSDKCWFIGTKSYGVFRWGDQCILMNDSSVITNAGSKLDFRSGDTITMESTGEMMFKSGGSTTTESAGKILLKAGSKLEFNNTVGLSLCTILTTLLTSLKTATPATAGSPAAHAWNPAIPIALDAAKASLELLMD